MKHTLTFEGKDITFEAEEKDIPAITRIMTGLVTMEGFVNIDVDDVRAAIEGAENVVVGEGTDSGDDRARVAALEAVKDIKGANSFLINITTGPEISLMEMSEAANVIQEAGDPEAQVIWGHVIDEAMGDNVRVSVIAGNIELSQKPKLGNEDIDSLFDALGASPEMPKPEISLVDLPEGRYALMIDGTTIAFHASEKEAQAAAKIASELIAEEGFVNIDAYEVKQILDGADEIYSGEGTGTGGDRVRTAAQEAMKDIHGAKKLLVAVKTGTEITLAETAEAAEVITESADPEAQVIWGHVIDETMGDSVKVSVIAVI